MRKPSMFFALCRFCKEKMCSAPVKYSRDENKTEQNEKRNVSNADLFLSLGVILRARGHFN